MNIHRTSTPVAGALCVAIAACGSAAAEEPGPTVAAAALPPCPVGSAAGDDEVIAGRVRLALHADRYLLDRHMTVSADDGIVVLHGFVASDWDLLTAISVANQSACGRRVVNDLSIQVGGQR